MPRILGNPLAKVILAWIFFASVNVYGQTESSIEQYRRFNVDPNLRPTQEEEIVLYSEESAPETPGDDDLGVQAVLHREERYETFRVFGKASGFYTDNAFLTRKDATEDRFFAGEIGVSAQPKITDRLVGDVSLKQQFFRYDENPVLDFDGQVASAALTYAAEKLWDIALSARYTFTRLERVNNLADADSSAEFYKNHGVAFTMQKAFPFSKAHYAFVGLSSEFGFTDWGEVGISNPQKDEYSAFAGYQANLTRDLSAQAFLRIAFSDYNEQGGRKDLNETASVAFAYSIIEQLKLSLSTSLSFNQSNQPVIGDYTVWNSGVTLNLQYRF